MTSNPKFAALPTGSGGSIRLPDLANVLFQQIGEDPAREGLQKTPERFAKALLELTKGYSLTGLDAIGEGIFASESSSPVCVKDIEFFSLCEHHILPFWGKASVAYLPNEKILGLSKIARVVDVYSKRLQVQERLTAQIGECLKEAVNPRAVLVSIDAQHMCMMMRGVGKISSSTKSEFIWKAEDVSDFEIGRVLAQLNSKE
jgi:GTP cyclohydrolase IA